jgi:predicted RNase H-like nuclease
VVIDSSNLTLDDGSMSIIGIDCATQPNKVGLALGSISNGLLTIDRVEKVGKNESIADLVSSWVKGKSNTKTLIAIDAPLGWPIKLGEELITHVAGSSLSTAAHPMFRRRTDFFIKEKANKQSLDVGADRIARTAHAALTLIEEIKEQVGVSIPLAWNSELAHPISVIEVYPAVTLKSCDLLPAASYKKEDSKEREQIYDGLSDLMSLSKVEKRSIIEDDDILDAVVCVLAGYHFVNGESEGPTTKVDRALAEKEGWIWVKMPELNE